MARRRAYVRILVSVLAGTLALMTLSPAVVQAAELKLDPTHGPAGDPFSASFVFVTELQQAGCGAFWTTVVFYWDSTEGTVLGVNELNSQCRAGIDAVPPSGQDGEGLHQVIAGLCQGTYPDCDGFADQTTATYLIDPPPTPSPIPTATPTPTPPPTPKPTPTPFVAPPVSPTAAPTATPTPTPIPTPSPSPTPTSTPSPSPTPTASPTPTVVVAPATASPTPTADGSGGSGGGGGAGEGWGPSAFVLDTPDAQDSSLSIAVLSTNLLLTLLLLLIFGTTSAIFNSTLESNKEEIDGWLAGLRERLGRIGRPIAGLTGGLLGSIAGAGHDPRVRVVAILLVTGLVYGFLSPDFGLNAQSGLLFISLALGIGAVTYINEGGAAIFASRRLHVPAGVRVHVAALLAAILCVLASRLIDFRPGIVYGFVASTAFLVPAAIDRRGAGKAALYPAIALLTASLLAWALLGIVRGMETGADGWALPLGEALLAVLFVVGLEGVFYNMIPLTFMDGRAVADWSRPAWALIFGVTTFLFWQLLINPNAGYLDALRETKVVVVLSLVAFYVIVTLGTWSYFRWRSQRAEATTA